MNLNRSLIRASALILALACGMVAVHFVARAAETGPAIHVDSTPINREPQTGNSYSPVIKKVAPSVVNIYSTRLVKQRFDPFFRQFFGDQEVTRRENWLGCGVIVTANGYILTANHVVEDADEIKVGFKNDATIYSAKVVGLDSPTDVAILKIEAKNLPAVTIADSDQLEVGDVVLAVGNPFGIGQTVTRGIISALGRSITDPSERQYQDFIQTDAAINEGNSGGALVDAEGRLIGINDAIVSPSHTSAGIGFAVPVNLARSVMEGFINGGHVARGYLGIEPQDIDANLAKGFGAPSAEGALVVEVTPDSPAAKAGLVAGDDIVDINGKVISSADSLRVTVSQLPPGSEAKVKIYRNGVPKAITVTLAERPQEIMERDSAKSQTTTSSNSQPAKADALDGVVVQDLSSRLRRQLGVQPGFAGALITVVDRSSNSYEAGLRPGDVILEIDHKPVTNADEAARACKAARGEVILVKIWRPVRDDTGITGITRFLSVDNTKRTN